MKAYYCVGGPLDGEYATTKDFDRGVHYDDYPKWNRPEGMYSHLQNEYCQFNNSGDSSVKMIWIHTSLLKAPISPKDR